MIVRHKPGNPCQQYVQVAAAGALLLWSMHMLVSACGCAIPNEV